MLAVTRRGWGAAAAAVAVLSATSTASAKPARCFTTDDGYFGCHFRGLDNAGSFRIRAPGHPTCRLEVDRPGFGFGCANFGSGSVALPGQYVRSRGDAACWNNPETSTRICAG